MILKNKIFGGIRSKGIFKNGGKIKPLITVVTVVLNGEKYLEEAILSEGRGEDRRHSEDAVLHVGFPSLIPLGARVPTRAVRREGDPGSNRGATCASA